MQYAKRKIISIAIIAGLWAGNVNAFPAIDYPSIPLGVQENLQKIKEYGGRIHQYTTKMQNFMDNTVGKIAVSTSVNSSSLVKQLGFTEDVKNIKTQEQFAPLTDVCNVMVSKKDESDDIEIAGMTTERSRMQSDRSVTAISFKEGLVTHGDDKNTELELNQEKLKDDRNKSTMDRIKGKTPELWAEYSSPEERVLEIQAKAGNPKPYDGDLMMNPRAYMTYSKDQKEAVETMVSDIIVPPYDPEAGIDSSASEDILLSILKKHLHYQLIHDTMTQNYMNRVQVNGGISKLEKVDQTDIYYFRGDDTRDSLFHRAGNDLDELTPTTMLREQTLMQASQIHRSLEEYKLNLNKEVLLAQNILLKLEEQANE